MEWSASPVVPTVQREPALLEEVDRDWFVSLGCHMEHVYSIVVFGVNICPFFNQKLTRIWITLKRSKVQGCEPISKVLLIDP